jgi:hypothetical protein
MATVRILEIISINVTHVKSFEMENMTTITITTTTTITTTARTSSDIYLLASSAAQ